MVNSHLLFLLINIASNHGLVRIKDPQATEERFVPSHMQLMHGMNSQQQAETIQDVQNFISSSAEGFATLVLMGDSTMAGVVTELLNVSEEVQNGLEILYVSNDRAAKVRYGCNEACGGVPPGGEWVNESKVIDKITRLTVKRAKASTRALHKRSCNSGGGLETYVFRSGPYKNLVVHHWGFLPEYAQFCWHECMTEGMAALKANVVVWNVGFHLLNHDFNPNICKHRHNPTKPGCKDYHAMVRTATDQMLESGVGKVVWKHTNWVCESRQIEGFPATAAALAVWQDTEKRPALEEACKKDCPQFDGLSCYDWFFDSHTSTRMYNESSKALSPLREKWGTDRVLELDAYNPTRLCCDRGCKDETDDGEHYAGLDAELAVQLAAMLS